MMTIMMETTETTSSSPSKSRRGDQTLRSKATYLLWLLIALAFGLSITNVIIGQHGANVHHHKHQYAHEESPVDRQFNRRSRDRHIGARKISDNAHNIKTANNPHIDEVYDGEHITQILRGDKPFPSNIGSRRKNDDNMRLKYRPGTLQMSSADALQYCYVNTTHYQGHISTHPQCLVSLSNKYKLIYRNIPKSSSSSARHAMQDFLYGDDNRMKHDKMETLVHEKGYHMVSFIREPMNRFYSSYDEAFFRMGPWMGEGHIVRDKPRVRKAYYDNKWKVDPYPYLYEGLETIHDYRLLYCPEEVLNTGKFLDCNEIPSNDDGALAHRFEQFTRDYTGLDPFDIHLNLQISNLVFTTGEPFPVTELYNATTAEKGWQEIANSHGVTIPDGEMTHGRKITRRFNVSKVSDTAKRKICKILALDYCCLNIPLPEVCRGKVGKDGDAIYCSMERRNKKTPHVLHPFIIHPWKDP